MTEKKVWPFVHDNTCTNVHIHRSVTGAICAQIIRGINFHGFRGPGVIRKYFNLRIFGRRCCVTVKMDLERSRAHCPIVAFAASVGPNTTNASLLNYQLIICVSWCEAPNDVDSFLIYGQAARTALVGNGRFFFCGRCLRNRNGFSELTIPRTPKEERTHCFSSL